MMESNGRKKKFQSGIEEAVLRNIEATHEFSEVVRTSMGPNGKLLYGVQVKIRG